MRVANQTTYENVKINLARVTEEMVKANNIVSSGKKINNLSDDPVSLMSVLDIRASLREVEQLKKNITTGKSWLQAGESALSQVNNILSKVKELTVQMANATVGASERSNAAEMVDGFMRQILSLANTQIGGKYIFSGNMVNTAPFSFDDEDSPTQVTYNGNDEPFSIRAGEEIYISVGRDGEQIFGDDNFDWSDKSAGSTNIFKTLMDLKSALRNNSVDGIQNAMGKLDEHMNTVQNMVSDTGIRITRLEVKEQIIEDLKFSYTKRQSELEDVDIAEAIIDLQTKQLAYKSALASSAKIMQLSLVDFI